MTDDTSSLDWTRSHRWLAHSNTAQCTVACIIHYWNHMNSCNDSCHDDSVVNIIMVISVLLLPVMLIEDKFLRPRTNRQGRGQTFEDEAEAKTMRPRTIFQDQRSPLILLCLRHKQSSISMSHPYCHLSSSSSIIVRSSSQTLTCIQARVIASTVTD